MTEYIAREAALNFEVDVCADDAEEILAISKGFALAINYIKTIPAADVVKRRRGKWITSMGLIDVHHRVCKCDQCGNSIISLRRLVVNFCPNCGADMREEDDDAG